MMSREDKNFPEQLRMWRKSRRLTQTQAGKVLCVSANTISSWERGKVPPERFRRRIAEELGVEESILFDIVPKEFNTILKPKRLERGLTQKELSDKLGYSVSTINNWENGASISEFAIEDICTFFGIEIQERK